MIESSNAVVAALSSFFDKSKDPVLFSGAGVSMLAGLPDWRGLLSQMADYTRHKDSLTADMMQQCVNKGSLTKAADYFWLCEDILVGDKHSEIKRLLESYDSKPLYPLASLPFKGAITTNFDRSLLDAFAFVRKQSPRDYRLGDASFSSAIWETNLNVARIHGCVEAPQAMVLSETQFERLLERSEYFDLLMQTFLHKQVLFIGFSFYDPAIKYVLEQIEKRYGAASPGRHLAILPSSNASELIQKASSLNIQVVKYDTADRHRSLWEGVVNYSKIIASKPRVVVGDSKHPYAATKQYLAACYARSSVSSEHTPLREVVIEGVLSATLQDSRPNPQETFDLYEKVRKVLGLKGPEVKELVDGALEALIESNLVKRSRNEEGGKSYYLWSADTEEASSLADAIKFLTDSICKRAYVQEGWNPPQHVIDVIGGFLQEVVHQRGWDLGAAFAAGKAPDNVSFRPLLLECGSRLSTFDRERVERTVDSLLQRPTENEARILGELGRVSFAVELAFQAPRTTLLHKAALPNRLYFDANILLPTFVEGHPQFVTYTQTLRRLKAASERSNSKLQLIAYSGYLNEMMGHKSAALSYFKEAGKDFEEVVRSDALYQGAGSINVYLGAYASSRENGEEEGFEKFIGRVAPYKTELELRRWIEKRGFLVVDSRKNENYAKLYSLLEKSNASKLTSGKQPILIEHDALQLALLSDDYDKSQRALFVTADRQLYEDVASSSVSPLSEFMVSHVGIVQLVDLLVGFSSEDRAFGELLWSNQVSERARKIQSYLTVEALSQYDAALAMDMHSIVEAHAEEIARKLEREGMDLESQNAKDRIKAFRSLGALENNFFSGMGDAINKLKKSA